MWKPKYKEGWEMSVTTRRGVTGCGFTKQAFVRSKLLLRQ